MRMWRRPGPTAYCQGNFHGLIADRIIKCMNYFQRCIIECPACAACYKNAEQTIAVVKWYIEHFIRLLYIQIDQYKQFTTQTNLMVLMFIGFSHAHSSYTKGHIY